MADWNELDRWDVAGGVAEKARPYLKTAADAIGELVALSRVALNEQRQLLVSDHQMASAWDKVTNALKAELTIVQQQVGNQMTLARISSTMEALENIDWHRDFQVVAGSAEKNIAALAKNLGSVLAVAEVLAEIASPTANSYDVGSTAIGALAGVLVGVMITATAPVWVAVVGGITASMAAKYFWEKSVAPVLDIPKEGSGLFWDSFFDAAISIGVSAGFISARNLVTRRDPLVFDLDGDGLELAPASGNTLFDHNADGIKTGTGWARPDDGFLVRDINGNGTIDTGRELFGVDTIKSNGLLATDGFDALRDLDSNGDGVITSADAAYGELRIWQDSNQDGISQASELRTLADAGITSIGVNGTHTGPQAGQVINNNSVALSTTFTVNGQTRTVGAIDLEANNFFTEFPPQVIDDSGNPIPISAQAQALPQMNGSGMVRDLCQIQENW